MMINLTIFEELRNSNIDHNRIDDSSSYFIPIYIIIIALGLLANLLLIYLFLTNSRLRNVRNAFMANLALSNLFLVGICTPFYLYTRLVGNSWKLGSFLCKFLHSLEIVIILVSAFSIMMISIDRWMIIVLIKSHHLTSRQNLIVILCIWLIAILLSIPQFIYRRIEEFKFDELNALIKNATFHLHTENDTSLYETLYYFPKEKICSEDWKAPVSLKRTYMITLFCLEFLLPCLCMFVLYVWIIRFLKQQLNRMSHYELLKKRLIKKEKPHKKNCKLLSALCLTFIISCLPLSIFNIVNSFRYEDLSTVGTQSGSGTKEDRLQLGLSAFAAMSAILNPILYGWMNQNFRQEIIKKLKVFRSNTKQQNNELIHMQSFNDGNITFRVKKWVIS